MAALQMWTVYRPTTTDLPGKWVALVVAHEVVRVHEVRAGSTMAASEPWSITASLQLARDSLPRGIICVHRDPSDDPVIEETWL